MQSKKHVSFKIRAFNMDSGSNRIGVSKEISSGMDGFACGEPRERLKTKEKVIMVVAALAAYKHDTLGHYLPTVLHFRMQATLFRQKF